MREVESKQHDDERAGLERPQTGRYQRASDADEEDRYILVAT